MCEIRKYIEDRILELEVHKTLKEVQILYRGASAALKDVIKEMDRQDGERFKKKLNELSEEQMANFFEEQKEAKTQIYKCYWCGKTYGYDDYPSINFCSEEHEKASIDSLNKR